MSPDHAPDAPRRATTDFLAVFGVAAVIALSTLVAYRDTLSVPFVLDDTQAITDNHSIRSFSTAWSPPKDATTTGRPVANLSLALNYAMGGLDVAGYHAVNFGIHLLAALVLFGVIRRTLLRQCAGGGQGLARPLASYGGQALGVAFSVALLWAVHPLQTESVTYTIQRTESLMGLFYLFTLYAFIRASTDEHSARSGRIACYVLSFAACLLGMATKEVMVSAPLIVLLYDRTFVAGSFRTALRQRALYYSALAATWLLLAALVISAEGRGGTAGLSTKISPFDYALTQCSAIVHYLRLALWPSPLVFDYGNATVTVASALIAPALLLIALGAGTVFALRTRPALGFLGMWFFAILAPSSSIVPIATQTIAEHRIYLSLAAVLTLLVVVLYRWLGRNIALAVTIVVAAGLVVMTSQRNAIYRDPLTLWTDTLTKAPDNPRAIINVGLALIQVGRVAEAEQHLAAAVERRPDVVDLRINYANALGANLRFAAAIAQLEAALRLDPANFEAHTNLGIILAQSGRIADARSHFERALQLKPNSPAGHRNLGLAFSQSGRAAEALTHFEQAAQLAPDDPVGLNTLGVALASAGRLAEAQRQFARALELRPDFAEAAQNLARARTEAAAR